MSQQRRFFALFILIFLLVLLDYGGLDLSRSLDDRAGDALMRQHVATRTASPDIVVIDIDQKSLEQLNEVAGSWPWPRAIHAEMIDILAAQHPRAIVFDILFNEPDTFRPDSDALLRDTALAHDSLYFPYVLLGDGQPTRFASLPAETGIVARPGAPASAGAPLLLPSVLPPKAWRGGLINFDADHDGIGRHYLVDSVVNGWMIPSMPARVARDLGWAVPTMSRLRLNWTPLHQHVSFGDLYLDANREQPQRPRDEFAGKIVVIGTAAPGLMDLRPTPLSQTYPGVEILASALDNLQKGNWLTGPDRLYFAPLALLLCALLWLGFARGVNTLWLGVGLALATLAAFAAMWLALDINRYWSLTGAIGWAWTYFWLAALLAYLGERARREQAVQLFGRFLDKRVVRDLVESGQIDSRSGASSRQVSVLFSDIRGFTSLSETRPPEEIVNLLNRYFSRQVEVIFRHGGTLDKFIGDAIMAFWGAPVDDPHHAEHAVAAALEMSRELEAFKRELAEQGVDFDIGIGIHSGPAVVGFIGAQARLDYTAIGDTVNLASRIEGETKGVARVLVSEATRDACDGRFGFVERGLHHVKGRGQPVRLFEPHAIDSNEKDTSA
ncbi:adenylate/guanylate cyclase domain-containing protein [Chitiniphilus eburneus]|uniref:Adenylate/guanylate cyclase domain-containing protein n=1 Tax=Chitiniphilus eburneus TaxID=2571148 RepID=A0A4U0PUE4_9NEIS|nr:adenylate/guanylate cyclase domain-containing protein [Chitiniphilus eburneus]TJZ72076.1 adenylate/guanylate cyclase domain-containing protein [Chitiniphilus eburneus]